MSVAGETADRASWGMTAALRNPQEVVHDISRLLALTKTPTIIAVDQLDTMFAQTNATLTSLGDGLTEDNATAVGQVADGLLSLRDTTLRTLTVVSLLPDALLLLKKHAATPVLDRFRQTVVPDLIPSAEIAEKIVAMRFTARFRDAHFSPPYDTWPIKPEAFKDAKTYSPRGLLRRIDRHVTYCLNKGEVVELTRLGNDAPPPPPPHRLRPQMSWRSSTDGSRSYSGRRTSPTRSTTPPRTSRCQPCCRLAWLRGLTSRRRQVRPTSRTHCPAQGPRFTVGS
jgi:hypothetical protein